MRKRLLPIIVFLVFACLYYGIAYFSDGEALYKPIWDIQHYVNISESGYEVHPCTQYDYPPGDVCGNVGWYPFWPLVMKAFRPILGGSSQTTYIFLSLIMTCVSCVLLFRFIKEKYDSISATITISAILFGPAGFYLLTGFPYALFLLLFTAYLYSFYVFSGRIKTLGMIFLGMALSLTYPTGILYAGIPFFAGIIKNKGSSGSAIKINVNWKAIIIGVAPFILGLLLLWLYFHFKFDNFLVQLDFQARYERTWSFPLTVIFNSLSNYQLSGPENLVIIWYGLALILFAPYKVKPELWIMAILLFLFSPATGTTMSIYRHYLAIFPIYMIVGISHRPVLLKIGFILIGLIMALFGLFPIFLDYKLI